MDKQNMFFKEYLDYINSKLMEIAGLPKDMLVIEWKNRKKI